MQTFPVSFLQHSSFDLATLLVRTIPAWLRQWDVKCNDDIQSDHLVEYGFY